MKKNSEIELKPRLRFPKFRDAGGWEEKRLVDLCSKITQGGTPDTSKPEYWGGSINWLTPAEMGKTESQFIHSTNRTITESGLNNCSSDLLPNHSVILSTRAPIGHLSINTSPTAINQGCRGLIVSNALNLYFLYYSLIDSKSRLIDLGAGNTFKELSGSSLKSFEIWLPSLAEQQKIADCLTSIDELIAAQTRKVNTLKAHKKWLMQNLFPREDETQPRLRFPEFRGADGWEKSPLGDLLDYQQPTDYLVTDTKYSDMYKTPVLTAGKTFILGYTNEQHGIFRDNLPVIIFDDFTTATQFVDFPFKAKSSAMKILQAKNGANIKFIYEIMQMIAYEVGAHKRHWISKFAPMSILVPRPNEQQKIADCLTSVDKLIAAQTQKLVALNTHKKGLMQQFFPSQR